MVREINIKDEKQWLEKRGCGIGASEVSALLGYNSFLPSIQLWHNKLGFTPRPFFNIAMGYGKASEAFTSDLYRSYNGDDEKHGMDLKNKKFYRECEKFPDLAYFENPDFCKYLMVSPDRKFTKTHPTKGIISGLVEIKDSSKQYLNSFLSGISISHEIQLKTQMAVTESDYGTLVYILDRREYREHDYERDRIIVSDENNGVVITETDLADKVTEFWESVVKARTLTNEIRQCKLDFNLKRAEELQAQVDDLEPPPDCSLGYESFLKETAYSFARPCIEIKGDETHEILAEDYLKAKEKENAAKTEMQLMKNKVLNVCRSGNKVILPSKGYLEVIDNKGRITIKVKN